MILSDDAWVHIGLHLKPRHLSKLMRTCKRIKRLVDNETYWTRVAAHLVLRDSWFMRLGPPRGEKNQTSLCTLVVDPGLYYMVGRDQGYYQGMQQFIQGIKDSINDLLLNGDEDEQRMVGELQGLCLQGLIIEFAMDDFLPDISRMKGFAKDLTVDFWVTRMAEDLSGAWPRLQKFLFDLEDDPMPAKYKRQIFRKMWDTVGDGLALFGTDGRHVFIGDKLCIF